MKLFRSKFKFSTISKYIKGLNCRVYKSCQEMILYSNTNKEPTIIGSEVICKLIFVFIHRSFFPMKVTLLTMYINYLIL